MPQLSKAKIYAVLFLPFILSMIISSMIIGYHMQLYSGDDVSPEEIGVLAMRVQYTYSFYWSILQILFGLIALRYMGGLASLKKVYSIDDITRSPLKSIGLIIGLYLVTTAIIWGFQGINMLLTYSGSWEEYSRLWREVIEGIPLYTKLYMVLVAPFTAGIFEEIIWRWFGIESLSKYYSVNKAVITQAIAFGLWHGLSLHAVATMIIGIVYGLVYARRRRLLVISLSHIVTDIIGFYLSFFTAA
ncbi:MAG: hypothetical protein DRO40_05275 [Thermoprotei archaeon]|nr:MAG: hypothetical protein DRO40_05275 [Thermoprotei archaeon]